jgi:hypothetical protein
LVRVLSNRLSWVEFSVRFGPMWQLSSRVKNWTDQQLMREYAERHSEPAFAELVRRHLNFTYSAVLRMTRNPHLAEDVSQAVFAALARGARQLTAHPVLSG